MSKAVYPARDRYRDPAEAQSYNARRFRSWRGRLVDRREQELIANAIDTAGIPAGGRVLDLPAGTGRLARLLASRFATVIGADLSPEMLRQAGGYASRVTVADATALPFSDRDFDLVVSLRFTAHLPPPVRRQALSEMARVSRRYLVVACYDSTPWTRFRRRLRRAPARPWFSEPLARTREELATLGLRVRLALAMLPFFSETWILLLEREDATASEPASAGAAARQPS